MRFEQVKSKERLSYFIKDEQLEIHVKVDDMNRITQLTCTKDGKTKIFKVSGADDAAITRTWQVMEKFIGNIKHKTDGRVHKETKRNRGHKRKVGIR